MGYPTYIKILTLYMHFFRAHHILYFFCGYIHYYRHASLLFMHPEASEKNTCFRSLGTFQPASATEVSCHNRVGANHPYLVATPMTLHLGTGKWASTAHGCSFTISTAQIKRLKWLRVKMVKSIYVTVDDEIFTNHQLAWQKGSVVKKMSWHFPLNSNS